MDNLTEFKNLKSGNLLREGQIIVEGRKGFLKLLQSDFEIKKIIISDKLIEDYSHLNVVREKAIVVSEEELRSFTGFNYHKGILALAQRNLYSDLAELHPPYLVLNGLTSPENVGSIIRTCAGFGFKSIIIDRECVSPYLRRCIRVSMGNIFNVKVHQTNNLLDTLKKLQVPIIGTANTPNSKKINDWIPVGNEAIIIGSEGHGIDSHILEKCDQIYKIPVDNFVNHLNASVAAAIFLYHFDNTKIS
ncbi:MAG: TrmH family RNA methyltransferase [Bacteriovoracaceae bacterium]